MACNTSLAVSLSHQQLSTCFKGRFCHSKWNNQTGVFFAMLKNTPKLNVLPLPFFTFRTQILPAIKLNQGLEMRAPTLVAPNRGWSTYTAWEKDWKSFVLLFSFMIPIACWSMYRENDWICSSELCWKAKCAGQFHLLGEFNASLLPRLSNIFDATCRNSPMSFFGISRVQYSMMSSSSFSVDF